MAKNTVFLWFNGEAEAAARFYTGLFPDSEMGAICLAPMDYQGGKQGEPITVAFTVAGVACIGMNGGPGVAHSEAFSFQIATDTQEETDRYWNAIVAHGGSENVCGWCVDRWGIRWQITPRVLSEALVTGGDVARRAFEAMLSMRKIDVAVIEAAVRGKSA